MMTDLKVAVKNILVLITFGLVKKRSFSIC